MRFWVVQRWKPMAHFTSRKDAENYILFRCPMGEPYRIEEHRV